MNYGKTLKGKSALEQRSAALPQRLRPLLLLVDGHKTGTQLESLAGQIGLPAAALAELEQLGFIALGAPPSGDATERRFEDDDDRTVRVSPNSIDRFLQAKRYMSDALAQAGVSDSSVRAEIERAVQMSDLTALYDGFVALIEARRGADAPTVIARLQAMLS
jgi:adenylate kinase